MRLFATASNAVIHAVDGENGQTLWQRRVGSDLFPSFRVAANEEHLAVVNGSTLYILDQETGRELWHRATVSIPGAAPALSAEYAFVPTVTAGLEVYVLDASHAPKTIYHASGRNVVQPVVTTRSVTWPTNRGHMYVAEANGIDPDPSESGRRRRRISTDRRRYVAPVPRGHQFQLNSDRSSREVHEGDSFRGSFPESQG